MSPTVPGGYPTTNTHRLVVQYEGNMGKRSLLLRFSTGTALSAAVARANTLTNLFKALWHNSVRVTGGLWYPKDSVISQPVILSANNGTVATTFDPTDHPVFYSFVGRSFEGTRVRYFLYGLVGDVSQTDYRYTLAESAALTNIHAGFVAGANAGELVTVQGSSPVMNEYINTGYNAYYQRQRRRIA